MKTNSNIDLFLTAEKMLKKVETAKKINSVGGKEYSNTIIKMFLAKTKNYKPNIYYHIEDGLGMGYGGVGSGLYLGKDREALVNFYDIEGEGKEVKVFMGNPYWLDLMDYDKCAKFEKSFAKKNINILNSDWVGKVVSEMRFDGIRYYDPTATGEEYVLFNNKKVKKIKTEKLYRGGLGCQWKISYY